MAFRIRGDMRKSLTAYALILPAFIVVFVLAAYSAYSLIRMSMVKGIFGQPIDQATYVGLDNFKWLLFDNNSNFIDALWITIIFVGGCLIAELVFGLVIALLLNRDEIIGKSIFTAILIIPIVVMPSMVGMVFRLYFSFDGLINYFVETIFTTKLNWYGPELALPAAMMVDTWQNTPFFILILLAGLQALPKESYEAARVDGASSWQLFWFVTLPMMAPLIITVSILRLMELLRAFDVIFVMFGGGPGNATTTLPMFVYKTTLVARDIGRGSASSIMLVMIIVSLTFLLVKLFQKFRYQA
jgi:multiple sugar transport system permease protein